MNTDRRPTLLFLYDVKDMPDLPFNYHRSAERSGFRVVIAPWERLVPSSTGLRITEGYEITPSGDTRPLLDQTYAVKVLIHRVWGASEPFITGLLAKNPGMITSFDPCWSTISDKRVMELAIRTAGENGIHVPRPTTYLPGIDDLGASFLLDAATRILIFKPRNGARGEGLSISRPDNFQKIWAQLASNTSEYVIQQIPDQPFLIQGRRCDLRLYALITSFDPLRWTLVREGVIRLAATRTRRELYEEISAIVTSYSWRRRMGMASKNFLLSELLAAGHVLSISRSSFWVQACSLLDGMLRAVQLGYFETFGGPRQSAFMLAGVDFLMLRNDRGSLKLQFLEINNVPGLGEWNESINVALETAYMEAFRELNVICDAEVPSALSGGDREY